METLDSSRAKRLTPYGVMVQNLALPKEDGTSTDLQVINPFAIFHETVKHSPESFDFYQKHLAGGGTIYLHMDDAKLGNVLRPDKGRSFWGCSWTLKELPDWYRSRSCGYFPLLYASCKMLEEGDIAALVNEIMQLFWSIKDNFNFELTGVLVSLNGKEFEFRAGYGGFIQDEKSHKETISLKGASGLKCCGKCMNVLNTVPPSPVHYFVGCGEVDRSRFIYHTVETYIAIADRLEASKTELGKGAFEELETRVGFTYNKRGILWNKTLRRQLRMPLTLIYDWMHSYLASGGIAQYECNWFVLEAAKYGFTRQGFDTFAELVFFRKNTRKLTKTFFRERIVKPSKDKPRPHAKCFASEVMVVIEVLELFSDVLLAPNGIMADHVKCIKSLALIMDLLRQ